MNQAVFWVTSRERANSQELMPFLALAMHQTATNHLSNPRGESSKIVPTFTLNCFRHPTVLHWRRLRERTTPTLSQPHLGQVIFPSGYLAPSMVSKQTLGSEK